MGLCRRRTAPTRRRCNHRRHRPAEEVHRAAGRVEVRLRHLRRLGQASSASGNVYTEGGKTDTTGSSACSTRATCPSTSPGKSSRRRATSWCRCPRTASPRRLCAGSPRTASATRPTSGPSPWETVGTARPADRIGQDRVRGLQPQALRRRNDRPGASGHGPAVHSSPGKATTRPSCFDKYPLQMVSPHPRFSLPHS